MSANINIIYEDKNLVIVNKPPNIEIIDSLGKTDLLSIVKAHFLDTSLEILPVHRLDAKTAGLVIFAKNRQAETQITDAIKSKNIRRLYKCIVKGIPQKTEATLTHYLKKDAKGAKVYISNRQNIGYKPIITKYKLLKAFDNDTSNTDTSNTDVANANITNIKPTNPNAENYSLLEVELLTGRTHQIRAHLAHMGHQLLGDDKYGCFAFNKQYKKRRQLLVAYKLILNFGEYKNQTIQLDKNIVDNYLKI
ncbi:MAG: RluA family pseudouridine synthase [Firmicutes bacterium]|nr:RluA family pseudouridine synthase [Bacillota bacterium]